MFKKKKKKWYRKQGYPAKGKGFLELMGAKASLQRGGCWGLWKDF